jgi:hypothetical protein
VGGKEAEGDVEGVLDLLRGDEKFSVVLGLGSREQALHHA